MLFRAPEVEYFSRHWNTVNQSYSAKSVNRQAQFERETHAIKEHSTVAFIMRVTIASAQLEGNLFCLRIILGQYER
jgi:hypothetical protein